MILMTAVDDSWNKEKIVSMAGLTCSSIDCINRDIKKYLLGDDVL